MDYAQELQAALEAGRLAAEVIRSTKVATFANRRAAAAKLRWAVRAV